MRVVACLVLLLLTGCGNDTSGPRVTVAAASSLAAPLSQCMRSIGGTKVSVEFGGSDALAAQIRHGVGIDVFASANMELPEALAAEGEAGRPTPFATNELVIAVRRDSTLDSLESVAAASGTDLVVGSKDVPVGGYTREVLRRLPAVERRALEAEIRSEEPDAKSIVGKLTTGAADAGFVYRTDVIAAGGELREIALPASVRPTVVLGMSVVRGGDAAEKVVADLRRGGCARALRAAGFGPPPS